jgi:hypothetical protein
MAPLMRSLMVADDDHSTALPVDLAGENLHFSSDFKNTYACKSMACAF